MMSRQAFTEKLIGRRNQFTVDEMALVQSYFGKQMGEDLPGWPFITLAESRALANLSALARDLGH